MVDKKSDYNNVPVAYCRTCLSLAVKDAKLSATSETTVGYCGKCSNGDIGEAHIHEWEEMYEKVRDKSFSPF